MTQEKPISIFLAKNLLKIILLIIVIVISIPNYYHFFDKGSQTISLDKISDGTQDYNSRNVIITGKLLIDKAIIETESSGGQKKYTRYIIPFVKSNHKESDKIYCFIEREFKTWEHNDKDFEDFQVFMDTKQDSLVTISGVAINFFYESLIYGLSTQSVSYFKSKFGLNISSSPILIQVNHEISFIGFTFMLILKLYLITFISLSYIKTVKRPKKTTEDNSEHT